MKTCSQALLLVEKAGMMSTNLALATDFEEWYASMKKKPVSHLFYFPQTNRQLNPTDNSRHSFHF